MSVTPQVEFYDILIKGDFILPSCRLVPICIKLMNLSPQVLFSHTDAITNDIT